MKFAIGAIALSVIATPPAFAQTQAQQDRLDRVTKLFVTSPLCRRLGMTVDPELPAKVVTAIKAETDTWQVDRAIIDRLAVAAVDRQGTMFGVDLNAAAANAKTEEQLRGIRTILLGYGRTCIEATKDRIFSQFVTAPPGYDLNIAVTSLADSMLESGGLASWQTPAVQARGDMMMLAGACRARIGPARSDALVSTFGTTDDVRVRDYYRQSFDSGLSDTELNFTLVQCNRAITNQRTDIAAAGR